MKWDPICQNQDGRGVYKSLKSTIQKKNLLLNEISEKVSKDWLEFNSETFVTFNKLVWYILHFSH